MLLPFFCVFAPPRLRVSGLSGGGSSAAITSTRWRRVRPSRSRRQTTSVSPERRYCRHASSWGRLRRVPELTSRKIRSQPAWLSASSCSARSCWRVETRALADELTAVRLRRGVLAGWHGRHCAGSLGQDGRDRMELFDRVCHGPPRLGAERCRAVVWCSVCPQFPDGSVRGRRLALRICTRGTSWRSVPDRPGHSTKARESPWPDWILGTCRRVLSKIAVDAGSRQLVDAPLPPTHLPGCGCAAEACSWAAGGHRADQRRSPCRRSSSPARGRP